MIKNCAIAFTNVLPTFAITVTFKDYKVLSPVINICFRLFLLQPSHLQNFVAGKHDYFFFVCFTGTTGTTKLRCQLPLFLFYLIDVPVKQKFTFYFIQCNIV